jgi:hypothetical protein
MPPRIASLTDLLNSLDAATYFFVSSTLVIAVAALLFFALGLWLGQILWRHYKRLFRQSEEVIESYKGEVAQLKRRLAEQSTRPLPGMGPSPLQSIAFRAAAPRASAPAVDRVPPLEVPFVPKVPVVADTPTSLRTEPDGKEEAAHEGSAALGVGPRGRPTPSTRRAPVPGFAPKGTSPDLRRPGIELLFTLSEVLMVPRSRAFCIWTESHWRPPVIRSVPMLPASGFALWTEPDFHPVCSGPRWPSKAHTVWTAPGWTSSYRLGPPTRSARAFTLWTEPGWQSPWHPRASKAFSIWTEEGWTPAPVLPQRLLPAKSFTIWTEAGWQRQLLLPWSKAFCLWTEPDWSPLPAKGVPWPASAAGSLWTISEFVPACRGPVLPSRAFTKWTEKGWSPPSLRRHPLPAGKPFTLWAEPLHVASPARTWFGASASATGEPAEKPGFVARTLAAAKKALGLGDTKSSAATRAVDAPAGSASESLAVAEVSLHAGPLPPSRAFTLWGGAPVSERARTSGEQAAAVPLADGETGGTTPPPPETAEALPPSESPASSSHADAEANSRHSSLLPPLGLEPLSVPGEGSPV